MVSNSLNITFFIPSFSDGGAQKQCIRLLNELRMRDELSLTLVTFGEGVHDAEIEAPGLEWVRLPNRSGFDPRTIIDLRRVLKRKRSCILITWLPAADVMGYVASRFLRDTQWVMTERDSDYPDKLRYRVRSAVGRRAHLILANSEAGADYWRSRGTVGAVRVVNNIVDSSARRLRADQTPADVVHVGRLETQKNVMAVVEAFCVAARRNPGLRFAFIGQGSLEEEIRDRLAFTGMAGRVELLGFTLDARFYIAHASAVVTLSHHEGLPNVLLECVAEGTPIVASDIPEHTAVLGEGYPYLVARTASADEVASMIERATSDVDARSHLALARGRIAAMTASQVADSYLHQFRIMCTLEGRNRK